MGLFERMGMKAEQRRLAPFFRPDEHFMETDLYDVKVAFHGESAAPSWLRMIVSFTSHALYARPAKGGGGDVVRVPYEQVLDVMGARNMTEISTRKASWLLREIGEPMGGDKFELVSAQLRRRENYRQEIDLPDGGSVEAVHRPMDEGDPGRWTFRMTDDVDLKDDDTRRLLEREMASAIERWGPLP